MQEHAPAAPYVDIVDLTADLVRAHVSCSDVPPELLRTLILEIHGTLRALADPPPPGAELPIPLTPGAVLASPEARAEVVAAAYEARETRTSSPAPEPAPEIEAPEPEPAEPETIRAPEAPRPSHVRALKPVSIPKPLPLLPDADEPAVEPERSLTPDAVIDLEGGKPHRDLGRFIADARGEDPDTYRRRFGLPKEYPMMAPRLIRTRGRVSELDPVTFRRLSIGPVERDVRFDGDGH